MTVLDYKYYDSEITLFGTYLQGMCRFWSKRWS